ncbi:MAG: Coenzyme F420 hydrogenase/dehydrogenase, beta subunit C-terminal domain [Clostridiales bacterium]|nr:Coenzyme F420 hydrogenase/dehydrogenase, beta subunit C-terminal domain [Clostridiales bacterium]
MKTEKKVLTAPTELASCSGCQACRLLCPSKAIQMEADKEGFLAPRIDQKLCTQCGLCEARCPQNKKPAFRDNDCVKAYGARLKDEAVLGKSASGGVFAGIARRFLETPGSAVFGCAFDSDLVARQSIASDLAGIEPMQGSKYVQSDTGDSFAQTKKLLESGNPVLYSGTPCQVAGLYAYLGKDYEKLATIDLICHGTPSPLLFKRYLKWLGNKHGGKIISYDFRSKDKVGWGSGYQPKLETATKTVYFRTELDPYFIGFNSASTMRECCYTCRHTSVKRVADLTIADFWGVEREHPEKFDRRGVSAVLANTEKGAALFARLASDFESFETDVSIVAKGNFHLSKPNERPGSRNTVYSNISSQDFAIVKDLCSSVPPLKRMVFGILSVMPSGMAKNLRKLKKLAKVMLGRA